VYANMTRFEWAYPSGTEHAINQWISGQTMVIATVQMNMMYLIAETRSRVGEPGINDPNVKLGVTCFTFVVLWMLQSAGVVDPSVLTAPDVTPADFSDYNLPLAGVCEMRSRATQGCLVFAAITCFCLGFTIFGTSAQSLTGLRVACCCCCGGGSTTVEPSDTEPTARSSARKSVVANARNNANMVNHKGVMVPIAPLLALGDRVKGQIVLFIIFLGVVLLIVLFFAFVPFYSQGGTRDDAAWKAACDTYDTAVLSPLGLS